jgi:hypothetical protein
MPPASQVVTTGEPIDQLSPVLAPLAGRWDPTATRPGSVRSQSVDSGAAGVAQAALGPGIRMVQLPATQSPPMATEPAGVGTDTIAVLVFAPLDHQSSPVIGARSTPVNRAAPTPKAAVPERPTCRSLVPGAGAARAQISVRQELAPPAD